MSFSRHSLGRDHLDTVRQVMEATKNRPSIKRTLLLAITFAALWTILAFTRTGTTYHLAPLLVAGVPAAGVGIEGNANIRSLTTWGIAGATIALGVTFLLSALGKLDGPSLLPFGGAAAEAVIFSVAGGFGGLAIGVWALRGH